MTKRDKDLERLRQNPRSVRFEDLDKVLRRFGFEVSQPRSGSSHYVYKHGAYKLVVAKHEPFVHSKAVKAVIDILDEIADLS